MFKHFKCLKLYKCSQVLESNTTDISKHYALNKVLKTPITVREIFGNHGQVASMRCEYKSEYQRSSKQPVVHRTLGCNFLNILTKVYLMNFFKALNYSQIHAECKLKIS